MAGFPAKGHGRPTLAERLIMEDVPEVHSVAASSATNNSSSFLSRMGIMPNIDYIQSWVDDEDSDLKVAITTMIFCMMFMAVLALIVFVIAGTGGNGKKCYASDTNVNCCSEMAELFSAPLCNFALLRSDQFA